MQVTAAFAKASAPEAMTALGKPVARPLAQPVVGGVCSVETVADASAFAQLETEWNDAVDRAAVPHPFLRHEWLHTWWECFGDKRALHIVIVRSNDRIIAIAPLLRESASMCGVPVRRLRLMHNDHTPRADFIVAEQGERAYKAIWRALIEAKDQWDVLLLGQLPRESKTRELFASFAKADSCTLGTWRSSDSPYLELNGTWEEYFGSLPAKFRSNVRNRISRLNRLGEPVLESIESGSAIDAALADTIRLEESGWKRHEGTAIASNDSVQRFYTRLAHRAAGRGWLRLLFLTVGGRRIATSYSLSYEGRLFLVKTGYDPTYETCSPFKVLTYLATKRAFEEGLDEVDFLGETEPWKREWTSSVRSHDWVFVFSRSLRARLAKLLKFHVVPAVRKWRRALALRSQA